MAKKLSNKQIKNIVEYEGLGRSIQSSIGHKEIDDKQLSKLWAQAKIIMDEIRETLKLDLDY